MIRAAPPATREAAIAAFAKSWRRGWTGLQWELEEAVHVDHRACLPDPVHGLHNVSLRCIWRFDAALRGGVQNGARPVQILRDGDRTDIRRPWHDRYWAGPTAAAADPWQTRLTPRHARLRWRHSPRTGGANPTGPYRIAPIARFLMLIGRVPEYGIGRRLRPTTLVSQTRQRSA